MQQNSDNFTSLLPSAVDFTALAACRPDVPFGDMGIDFLSSLSTELMRDSSTRSFPDVATFAFFCRKANLHKLRKYYTESGTLRLGRGLIFHVAPSNVPVNFAYSMVCGILSGNANVVRVPSKEFEQVDIISGAISRISDAHPEALSRLALIRYERGGIATDELSALCAVRVIWGGDATIANIRQSPIPPRSFDVSFADRYSFCAIEAEEYIRSGDAAKIAEGFYNDTFLFDQNACSAPHLVVWLGDENIIEAAKIKFWTALHEIVSSQYEVADVLVVDKLTNFFRQSLAMDIHRESIPDNLIWRVDLAETPIGIEDYRGVAGYFSEFSCSNLSSIVPIIKNRYQTLAYYGFSREMLCEFMSMNRPYGVDRIVPIGKTTEFSLTWDGYNLIDTLSREVSIL